MVELKFYEDLHWQSDWCGEEVGHDYAEIVGLYQLKDSELHFYIDMESLEVLEVWIFHDEDDNDTEYLDPHNFSVSY